MNGSSMNMYINEAISMNMFITEQLLISMNMFINEQLLLNMFINELFLVERRPTLSILDRACQASSRAGKPQLPFN
jgi:hypothetical protein